MQAACRSSTNPAITGWAVVSRFEAKLPSTQISRLLFRTLDFQLPTSSLLASEQTHRLHHLSSSSTTKSLTSSPLSTRILGCPQRRSAPPAASRPQAASWGGICLLGSSVQSETAASSKPIHPHRGRCGESEGQKKQSKRTLQKTVKTEPSRALDDWRACCALRTRQTSPSLPGSVSQGSGRFGHTLRENWNAGAQVSKLSSSAFTSTTNIEELQPAVRATSLHSTDLRNSWFLQVSFFALDCRLEAGIVFIVPNASLLNA